MADDAIRVSRWTRVTVLGLIVLSGLVALAGVVHWWPDERRIDAVQGLVPFTANGIVVVHADLVDVIPACIAVKTATSAPCGDSKARILDGRNAGRTAAVSLTPDVLGTGLQAGDRVLLLDSSGVAAGVPAGQSAFAFYRADRGSSLLWLAILFMVAVVAVALRRGVMALVSLGFAGVVVVGFLLPALLSGRPPIPVTLVSCVLILIVMLYLTHGLSMRTSVALVGALIGVALATLLAWAGITGARLGGLGDDSATLLTFNVHWVHVQQLVVASVLLASLGTLNDVTVTQVSALWELRSASAAMSRWRLLSSAMRIGRDHVASTVYTLVFAYLGTALVLLVAIRLYGGTPYDFLTAEDVAEEVVRTLVGGIAVVLTMPITTAIGTLVVAGASPTADPAAPAGPPTRAPRTVARRATYAAPASVDRYRRLPANPWDVD